MPALKPIEHGTYKGAQLHRKRGEKACRACLDAQAEYGREYRAALRAAGKDPNARQREQAGARRRALVRLAEMHRADFLRLYEEEAKES